MSLFGNRYGHEQMKTIILRQLTRHISFILMAKVQSLQVFISIFLLIFKNLHIKFKEIDLYGEFYYWLYKLTKILTKNYII